MIRRRTYETKINHERWLVSYADFITLLFAFFVVMYSVSQVNDEKYKQLSSTLGAAFSDNWPTLPTTETIGPDANVVALSEAAERLEKQLSALAGEQEIRITQGESWVEVALKASLLFSSGSAELSQTATNVLAPVVEIIGPYENAVVIEGHTDDTPISNDEFSTNWELASARALSVLEFLAFQGVSPQRLSALSFGEYKPVADNTTAEGRELNRRVVLRISSEGVDREPQVLLEAPLRPSPVASSESDFAPTTTSVSEVDEAATTPSPVSSPIVAPVRLQNGGLLFSSDPDLPRVNAPLTDNNTPTGDINPSITPVGEAAQEAQQ